MPRSERSKGARLARADIPGEVVALKRQPGKGMVLFGGVSTVQSFVQHGLIDEYVIKLHPVAIGDGLLVFTDLAEKARLTLTHSKARDSGIPTLRYQPARSPAQGRAPIHGPPAPPALQSGSVPARGFFGQPPTLAGVSETK